MKRQFTFSFSFICLVCLLVVSPVTLPLFSSPQGIEGDHPPVIAVVLETGIEEYGQAVEGFRETLAKEKITAHLEMIDRDDRNVISRVKELKPVLILTLGSATTHLIAEGIKDIPIIYSMVMDPKGSGITSRDIIGAVVDIPVKRQMETLNSVVPGIKRIGVVYNPAENEALVQEARTAAQELGLTLKAYPVDSETKIPDIGKLPIELLWIIPDNMVSKPVIAVRFLQTGLENKIAVMGFSRSYARSGALLGISCDYKDIGRQSGELAVRLLKGENYASLETCVPRVVNLYLNRAAAGALGITFPGNIIKKASEVF